MRPKFAEINRTTRTHAGIIIIIIIIIIVVIIETFVTRLLQLKNEHKRYICYGKIDKNR